MEHYSVYENLYGHMSLLRYKYKRQIKACSSPGLTKFHLNLTLPTHRESSSDRVILNYLSESVLSAGWYEIGTLHNGLIMKATAQGLDLQGAMTKERFGKRLASLKVYEKRNRTTKNGEKVMEYWMEPSIINSKLENHLKG